MAMLVITKGYCIYSRYSYFQAFGCFCPGLMGLRDRQSIQADKDILVHWLSRGAPVRNR